MLYADSWRQQLCTFSSILDEDLAIGLLFENKLYIQPYCWCLFLYNVASLYFLLDNIIFWF